jgi:hypothetical protein
LTPAARKLNDQILNALESIKDWASPVYPEMLLRNVIAASRFDERRERKLRAEWEHISETSTIRDLLVQIPMYRWPIPRDKACFYPGCDHTLTETNKGHLRKTTTAEVSWGVKKTRARDREFTTANQRCRRQRLACSTFGRWRKRKRITRTHM